jgi:hypothetical protein
MPTLINKTCRGADFVPVGDAGNGIVNDNGNGVLFP